MNDNQDELYKTVTLTVKVGTGTDDVRVYTIPSMYCVSYQETFMANGEGTFILSMRQADGSIDKITASC